MKRDVFPKLIDPVTGVNFLFVLEMRQTIKIGSRGLHVATSVVGK